MKDTNIVGDPEPPGSSSTDTSQTYDEVSAFEEPASALGDPEPPGDTGDPEPPGDGLPGTGGTGPS
jgi:hypothetical protein